MSKKSVAIVSLALVAALAAALLFSLRPSASGQATSENSPTVQVGTFSSTLNSAWTDCAARPSQSPTGGANAQRSPVVYCFLDTIPALDDVPLREIMEGMNALARQNPEFSRVCHQIKHSVAERLYEPSRLRDLIVSDDNTCFWGLSHGAIAEFTESADEEEFWRILPTLCDDLTSPGHTESCSHGLGHAIVMRVQKTIFEAEPHCAKVPQVSQHACVEAVIMSYSDGEASQNEGVDIKLEPLPDELVDTMCLRFSDVSKRECWSALWSFYPKDMPLDKLAQRAYTACSKATEDFAVSCVNGVGEAMMWRSLRPDGAIAAFEEGVRICKTLPDTAHATCIGGVAHSTPNAWFEDYQSLDEFPDICAQFTGAVKEECTEGIDAFMEMFE